MRKRVRPHNGLVGLDGDAGVCGHHLGGSHDLPRVDVAVHREELRTGAEGHHNLLQGGVTRALAEGVE
eukprot:scaffold28691_cov51-Isochrysis_galbana.AAC.1